MKDRNEGTSFFHSNKIPKDSRLERYINELPKVMSNDERVIPFIKQVFNDCLTFVLQKRVNANVLFMPRIQLFLTFPHSRFIEVEEKEANRTHLKEEVKYPELVKAFSVGNRFSKRIYIDVEAHIELLRFSNVNFMIGLVNTFLHELIHTGFRRKSEQEVFDLQNSFAEEFLGIILPKAWKSFKASDYYNVRRDPQNT